MANVIEEAKSGRASCRTCKKAIAKGELRLGVEQVTQFSDTPSMQWHHLLCAAGKLPAELKEALGTYDGDVPNRPELDNAMAEAIKKGGAKPGGFPHVDRAPTGRAKCMQCEEPIAKDSFRVAVEREVDTGAFTTFELPGGMIGDSLPVNVGPGLEGSYGQVAGSDSPGMAILDGLAAGGYDVNSAYTSESYDAAALFALAMQAAGSSNPADYAGKIMEVANAPGEKIMPAELAKGLQLLKDGVDIDFEGATAVELIGPGESAGRYREIVVKDGKNETVGFR